MSKVKCLPTAPYVRIVRVPGRLVIGDTCSTKKKKESPGPIKEDFLF